MTAGFCHPHGTPMTAPRDMSDSFTWLHCDMTAGASNDFVECWQQVLVSSPDSVSISLLEEGWPAPTICI